MMQLEMMTTQAFILPNALTLKFYLQLKILSNMHMLRSKKTIIKQRKSAFKVFENNGFLKICFRPPNLLRESRTDTILSKSQEKGRQNISTPITANGILKLIVSSIDG
jgi:hypothetical protein